MHLRVEWRPGSAGSDAKGATARSLQCARREARGLQLHKASLLRAAHTAAAGRLPGYSHARTARSVAHAVATSDHLNPAKFVVRVDIAPLREEGTLACDVSGSRWRQSGAQSIWGKQMGGHQPNPTSLAHRFIGKPMLPCACGARDDSGQARSTRPMALYAAAYHETSLAWICIDASSMNSCSQVGQGVRGEVWPGAARLPGATRLLARSAATG